MAYQPRIDKTGIYNSPYWYSSQNKFYPQAQLPNCTCYAYGRWLELGYPAASISIGDGNAQYWYPSTADAQILNVGQTPVLGAIACWTRGDHKRGHVGVVETIDANGDILVSMSGWYRPLASPVDTTYKYFWLERELFNLNYRTTNWMFVYKDGVLDQEQSYFFQGFIYPPNVETLDWMHEETDANPTMDPSYKENNARLIYGVLQSLGWRLEPICGVLGNMEHEGMLNPGQCELGRGLPQYNITTGIPTNVYYLPDQSHNYGLGLCGWTQAPNAVLQRSVDTNVPWYNGTMQCQLLNEADTMGFWIPTTTWPDSYTQFKVNANNRSVEDLASAFMWEYERPAPATAHEAERRVDARKWYNYLSGAGPVNPPFDPGTPTDPIKKMPIWAMIRYH